MQQQKKISVNKYLHILQGHLILFLILTVSEELMSSANEVYWTGMHQSRLMVEQEMSGYESVVLQCRVEEIRRPSLNTVHSRARLFSFTPSRVAMCFTLRPQRTAVFQSTAQPLPTTLMTERGSSWRFVALREVHALNAILTAVIWSTIPFAYFSWS